MQTPLVLAMLLATVAVMGQDLVVDNSEVATHNSTKPNPAPPSDISRRGESGSWCSNPTREQFWGHATAVCCERYFGTLGSDKRCRGLKGSDLFCHNFYICCEDSFGSDNNADTDRCT
jgi:hypothetical protein